MNGQMKRYKELLSITPEPVLLSRIQRKIDLRGHMEYAKEKGVKVAQLTEAEQLSIMKSMKK